MKKQETGRLSQTTLILRLLCGGYLLYLAFELRSALKDSPLYWIAIIVFAAVGTGLLWSTLRRISYGDDKARKPEEKTGESECEADE